MRGLIKEIFLTWRKGPTHRRHIVGVIDKAGEFRYLKENIEKATDDGFRGYPGIPLETENTNFLELFSKRIISLDRGDKTNLFRFWEINEAYATDTLYMLAMTQGKIGNDNFEFLASFQPIKGLCFVTDVAGISHSNFDLNSIIVGDTLDFHPEPENPQDKEAIAVYKGDSQIGYIKKGHHKVFNSRISKKLRLTVKAILDGKLYVMVSNTNT